MFKNKLRDCQWFGCKIEKHNLKVCAGVVKNIATHSFRPTPVEEQFVFNHTIE